MLTASFEFLFFHFIGGKEWDELLADYNVGRGSHLGARAYDSVWCAGDSCGVATPIQVTGQVRLSAADATGRSAAILIDKYMLAYHTRDFHELHVEAEPDAAYEVVRSLDSPQAVRKCRFLPAPRGRGRQNGGSGALQHP